MLLIQTKSNNLLGCYIFTLNFACIIDHTTWLTQAEPQSGGSRHDQDLSWKDDYLWGIDLKSRTFIHDFALTWFWWQSYVKNLRYYFYVYWFAEIVVRNWRNVKLLLLICIYVKQIFRENALNLLLSIHFGPIYKWMNLLSEQNVFDL